MSHNQVGLKDEIFNAIQNGNILIPSKIIILPVIIRPFLWKELDYFSSRTFPEIFSSHRPIMTYPLSERDGIWERVIKQIITHINPKRMFWKGRRIWKGLSVMGIVSILALILAFPSALKDSLDLITNSNKPSENTLIEETKQPSLFPSKFDSTTLYILVTRFEDNVNKQETNCYGYSIISRIDELKNDRNLPIQCRYLDSKSPIQTDEAEELRGFHNADLIIWGKLRNASSSCSSKGFCLKFLPSETLLHYTGGKIKKQIKNEFQHDISNVDIEEGLISMGDELFDDWLVEMSNLKIGRKKPNLFYIDKKWPKEKRVNSLLSRGSIWYSLKVYNKALADFRQANTLKKLDKNFYLNMIDCQHSLGNLDSALIYVNDLIEIYPNYLFGYHSRGGMSMNLKKYNEAILDFNKVVELGSDISIGYDGRGLAKMNLGRYSEAIADFDKSLSIQPNNSFILCNRGTSKLDMNKYPEAIIDLDKAILLGHIMAHTYLSRGSAKTKMKHYEEAIKDYNLAIEIEPSNATAYVKRGFAKSEFKQYSKAIEDFDRGIKLDPNNALYYNNRAGIKLSFGLKEEAIRDYEQAVKLSNFKEKVFIQQLQQARQSNIKPKLTFFERFYLLLKEYWFLIFLTLVFYFIINKRKEKGKTPVKSNQKGFQRSKKIR